MVQTAQFGHERPGKKGCNQGDLARDSARPGVTDSPSTVTLQSVCPTSGDHVTQSRLRKYYFRSNPIMLPEAALVICLCRTPLSNYGRGRIAVLLKNRIDWPTVFELAQRWEVQAVVCGNFRRWIDDKLPGSLAADAATIERRSSALSVAHAHLLLELGEVIPFPPASVAAHLPWA